MGKAARTKKERNFDREVVQHIISNFPEKYLFLSKIFEMFHTGAFENTLAVAECLDQETGKTEIIICGLASAQDGMKLGLFPLARMLEQEEVNRYLAPDGRGEYHGKGTTATSVD
jgi:hypothetical protein